MKKLSLFRIVEILIFIGLLGTIAYLEIDNNNRTQARDRDVIRITSLNQIRSSLETYHDEKGSYPACLYKTSGCTSLEGSDVMPSVPRDPLTNDVFAYAAFGPGKTCTGFHVGTSLERTASQALLVGADSPPVAVSMLCTGSAPDFSGLSYAPAGQPCNGIAGIAQPSDSPNGETCFDLKNHVR